MAAIARAATRSLSLCPLVAIRARARACLWGAKQNTHVYIFAPLGRSSSSSSRRLGRVRALVTLVCGRKRVGLDVLSVRAARRHRKQIYVVGRAGERASVLMIESASIFADARARASVRDPSTTAALALALALVGAIARARSMRNLPWPSSWPAGARGPNSVAVIAGQTHTLRLLRAPLWLGPLTSALTRLCPMKSYSCIV